MPSIIIKDTEHFDIGLRKFKRACEKAAIVPEIRASGPRSAHPPRSPSRSTAG